MLGVFQKMFDLDGGVVGDVRISTVQLFDNFYAMPGSVKKIRIAKSDMLSAGVDLIGDIFQHHVFLYNAELAIIDGGHGTMAADMFAAATGLCVADDSVAAIAGVKKCIAIKWWKITAIGCFKCLLIQIDSGWSGVGGVF